MPTRALTDLCMSNPPDVLYLTYDSQTSDTGLDTRIEAFYDMISMRKKVI